MRVIIPNLLVLLYIVSKSFLYFAKILDTRDLTIHNVQNEDGKDLKFTLGEPVLSFGSKLEVQLADNASEK